MGIPKKCYVRMALVAVLALVGLSACGGGGSGGGSGSGGVVAGGVSPRLSVMSSATEVLAGSVVDLDAVLDPVDANAAIEWTIGGVVGPTGASIQVTLDDPGLVEVTATAISPTGEEVAGGSFLTVFDPSGSVAVGFGAFPGVPGDADGNGAVSLRDALLVRRFLDGEVGLGAAIDVPAADLNSSGGLDDGDVALIQCIVQDQQPLPSVAEPSSGFPGTLVRITSSELLAVGPRFEIQFGDEPPVEAFRPRVGYTNVVVPMNLGAGLVVGAAPTPLPIRILADGQVRATLSFELSALPMPMRTADEALGAMPTVLRDALAIARDEVPTVLEAYTTDPEQIGAAQALFETAALQAADVADQMSAFLAMANQEQKELFYIIGRANGLDQYIDDLSGLNATPAAARQVVSLGGGVLRGLCILQGLRAAISTPAKIAAAACASFAITTLVFPPSATVTALVVPVCTGLLGLIGSADLALAFVPRLPAALDVQVTPTSIAAGETADISVSYTIGVGSALCSGAFEFISQQLFERLGGFVTQFIPTRRQAWELAKDWPVSGLTGNIVQGIQQQLEAFFTAATGVVGNIELISTRLQGLRTTVCGVGVGAVTFSLDPGEALLPTPFPASAGTINIPPVGSGAPAQFTCDPNGNLAMPTEVEFFASYVNCIDVRGSGKVICGGAEDVTICFGDCGNLLDDIFELQIDGETVSAPSAPVVNTCITENLSVGTHTATLIGRAAPDAIGTYCISFAGAAQNVTGPPLSGSDLVPGITRTWTFEVVENP